MEDLQKSSQPTCWTKWIRSNKNQLSQLSSWPHQHLKMRDSRFRYTIVHALMAGDIEEEIVRQCFNVLRKNSLISLITAKDKDGDTPLHSAIRSGTKPELIRLLMNTISGVKTKRRLLLEPNKRRELPIVSAFNLQRWSIVKVLLEECINGRLLPELTGIGCDSNCTASKTLLFKAMKRGFTRYLDIFLEVCRKRTNSIPMQAMLMSDKNGHTPWYYFLSLEMSVVEEGLAHLKKHKVNINKLLCEPDGRTGLLHEAFRRNNRDLINLLVEYGAKQDQLDANKLSPPQRRRVLSLDSQPLSPAHHGALTSSPVRVQSEQERHGDDESKPVSVLQRTEDVKAIEQVLERENDALTGGSESDSHTSDQEERAIDLQRAKDCGAIERIPEPENDALTEPNPQMADSNERRTPPPPNTQCCANLLDALDLELSFRLTTLSPRQEQTTVNSSTVFIAPRWWGNELHFKCFKFWAIADNHPYLRWTTAYAQVEEQWQLFSKEPELCPIYVDNSMYIANFNTQSGEH